MATIAHPLITALPTHPVPAPCNTSTTSSIPVIDVGALFVHGPPTNNPDLRKQLVHQVVDACETWGFFQLINHCVPLELIEKLFAESQEFFNLPDQDKEDAKQLPGSGALVRAGFVDDDLIHGQIARRERITFFFGNGPRSLTKYNIWPAKPTNLRETVEAYAAAARKMCALVLELVLEGLGVKVEDLHENYDESNAVHDLLMVLHYPPSKNGDMGAPGHADGNTLTLLVQDDVGGLEVQKDGQWRPVPPIKGAIIMNVGDVLQVWSNLKYKSVIHRVRNDSRRHRYSIPFFSSPPPDVVVKPLSKCSTKMGVAPRYRGFTPREYLLHRLNNRKIVSSDVEEIHLDYYAI